MDKAYQLIPSLICCLIFSVVSCKKSEDRACFKSTGELTSISIPLDSVDEFRLFKNIRYEIFQDSQREVVIRGGKNVVGFIEVVNESGVLSLSNRNRCNFFRKSEDIPTVEIHYPYLKQFYFESSDSVYFHDTIYSDTLMIEMRQGGGSLSLCTDVDFLRINVSYGTADYILKGTANNAEVKIQNNGFADASGFIAPYIFVYNNSTGDLLINLDSSDATVHIEGTGNVKYTGVPSNVILQNPGSGSFIKI